ncbi:MAG: tetratricopeptide repeat protein [Planctomycetota bacterium]
MNLIFNKLDLRWFKACCLIWLVFTVAGCRAIHPFAEKSRAGLATAKSWANRGLEAFQCGHLSQAKGWFLKAANEDPGDFRMRANLARTFRQSGDLAEAIEQMSQAVELSRGDLELRIELGEMYLESGNWLTARRQAEIALDARQNFGPAWLLLGKTDKSAGDHASALANYQRAIGHGFSDSDVQMELVDVYQKMNQPFRALSTIEQMLSRYSGYDIPQEVLVSKSDILVQLNQLEPAIEILEQVVETDGNEQAYLKLAQALSLAGKDSQARLTLNEAKRLFPSNSDFDNQARSVSSGFEPRPDGVVAR